MKKIIKKNILVAVLVTSFAGCATYGPPNSEEFNRATVEATPKKEGEVKFAGSATWSANVKGFAATRNFTASTLPIEGSLVITNRTLLFQQWDGKENKFSIIKKIAFDEIHDVSLDEFGRNRAIVVRSQEYQYDSFGYTQFGGSLIDADKTVSAQRYLAEMLVK